MPRPGRPTPFRGSAFVLLLWFLSSVWGCAPSLDDVGDEVWVIGLDGADWDMLEPLIQRGDMPNLAALRDGGAWGVLRSDEPLLSPVLWTSIATGRTPDAHGVTWFMTDTAEGTKVPVGTYDRRVHAMWNVAAEAGLSAGVVGWWASWPAEHLDGFVVSDYVGWHSFGVTGRESVVDGETWPPEIEDDVRNAMPHPDDVSIALLSRMVHLPHERLTANVGSSSYGDDLTHLRQAIATSRGYTDIVKNQLRDQRPELLCLYYEGTDAVMHLFGDDAPPRQPWITAEAFEAYSDVVSAYWAWQDELLGELLALRGPRTTVVVVSDHGFRSGDERRKEDHFRVETADADHMIDGLIVVNGPETPVGTKISGADIYDVAPTVLHALGLPVARELNGDVLADAFRSDVLIDRPVTRVASFENRPLARPPLPNHEQGASTAMEEMLRSLGYIAGTTDVEADPGAPNDNDGPAAVAVAPVVDHTAEQAVNLATILMKQDRLEEAIGELRNVLADSPEHYEARLNLAQALARDGSFDEAVALYRDLLAADPDRQEVYEDLALCYGRADRPEDALEVYEEGLTLRPDWVAGMAGKGHALSLLGQAAEAERILNEALALDPRHHGSRYYLGLVQIDRGDWNAAAATLQRAHELEPADEATALSLASVYDRVGRPDAALQILRRVLDNGGDSAVLQAELGATLVKTGAAAEALPHLHAAAEQRREDVPVLGNLGLAQAMTGDLAAAAATFERIVALEPEAPASHSQLGMFYARLGRVVEAEREFRTAVRYDGTDPVAHLHLGMILHQTGRLDEARTIYERTVDLAPDLAVAWYNLGMLEGAAGNRDEAARLLTRARELDPKLPQRGNGQSDAGRTTP